MNLVFIVVNNGHSLKAESVTKLELTGCADGVGEKFNFWPRDPAIGRCGEVTSKAGRRLRLRRRGQPRRPGNCAGSGSGRRVGTEAEKLCASPTGQGSVWEMDKLFNRVGMVDTNIVSDWCITCRKWEQKRHSRSYEAICSPVLASARLSCFSTAKKSCLTKPAVIAVVPDISVLQHSRRLPNVSQAINMVSVKIGPSWHFCVAPFLVLPSPWTGTRWEHFLFMPQIFAWVVQALTLQIVSSSRVVVWTWNFTSAVFWLNTAAFFLPLESFQKQSDIPTH